MFEKLKKALKVAKDLDTLDFTFDLTRISHDRLPFSLEHPNKLYSIWSANGFWFTALWEVDRENVYENHAVSKLGAIGKVIVWWKCQKHIRKWRESRKPWYMQETTHLIKKVMEDK